MTAKWRIDVIYYSNKQTHYFNNKSAAFEYLNSISNYLWAELFQFDGKIWKHKKIKWG